MDIIGYVIIIFGVMITGFGIFFYRTRIKELRDWIEITGVVVKRKITNLSPGGTGWQVTIEYEHISVERFLYTPNIVTSPFPIGFFIAPKLLYKEYQKESVCFKSGFIFKSCTIIYLGCFLILIGILQFI